MQQEEQVLDARQREPMAWAQLARFRATPDIGEAPLDPRQLDLTLFEGLDIALVVARMLKLGKSWDDIRDIVPNIDVRLAGHDPEADPAYELDKQLRERWEVLGIDYLRQMPEPPKYLIKDKIRQGSLVAVYGSPGDLKTMLLMDLAVCVFAGIPWLPPRPGQAGGAFQVNQAGVLWLDQDNGGRRLQERFSALLRAARVENPSVALHAISLPRPPFDVSSAKEADLLIAQIRKSQAGLCVIDNLGTVSGGRDENSSEMVNVMGNLRSIAEATDCTIIVIHHARKGGTSDKGRDGDLLRGHSSIEAAIDLALLVKRKGDTITVQSTKTRDNPVHTFQADWVYEQTVQGALWTAGFRYAGTPEPDGSKSEYQPEQIREILNNMTSVPNQSELKKQVREKLKVADTKAGQLIAEAVRAKEIQAVKLGKAPNSPVNYYPVEPGVSQRAE